MSTEIKSCYIYSDDKDISAIYLPDQTPIVVGRSPETKITNPKCSRNQVRLYASYASQMVFVQQLGHQSCGLNGFKTERGAKLIAKHGDCLEIMYGYNPYRVEFNPPPPTCSASADTGLKKRILSDSEGEEFENRWSGKKRKSDSSEGQNLSSDRVKREKDREGETDDFVDKRETRDILRASKKESRDDDAMANSAKETEAYELPEKTDKESWEELETLMIYTSVGVQSRGKIAAYDMDNTLIKTQSGYAFPKDHNDWQILYPEVPGKLKKLHADGYKIVIFTNQGGMFLGKVKPSDFKVKIERIVKKLGVPVQVFLAVGKDMYRKPRIGMWEKLLNDKNDGVPVDKSKSFFVGDAAGRPKDWAPGKKKDHSLADRLLGLNLCLTFYTPEEHFMGHKPAPYVLPDFNPKKLGKNVPICEPSNAKLTPTKQEVIIMVGGPGSGKTHFAKNYLKDYHYVNRDKLGSWQKCIVAMDNALSEGKSVVIDNTNPDGTSRKRFIDVAKAQGISVRCFVMKTEKEHSKHNNKFRELTDPTHMSVSDVIINSYSYTNSTFLWRCTRFLKLLLLMCLRLLAGTIFNNVQPYRKNYVAPKMDEGFSEIVRVNFVPRFNNDEHRRLYEMYLLEK